MRGWQQLRHGMEIFLSMPFLMKGEQI